MTQRSLVTAHVAKTLPPFCVVIPMYNEAPNAEKCVTTVVESLNKIPCRNGVIIVNDGSRDETLAILNRLKLRFTKLTVVSHSRNRGYGSALKTGVETALGEGFDYVLFMDSDLTNDPKDIPLFVEKMVQGYDVIKASRYAKGGTVRGVPIRRLAPSMIGNKIACFLYRLPISDCTNGFRAVKTTILSRMRLSENGFALIMEELYWSTFLAKSFCQITCTLTSRKSEATSKFSHRPQVFHKYLKYSINAFLRRPPPLAD